MSVCIAWVTCDVALMARRVWKQLDLEDARRPTGHGGWRPGAGRPRKVGAASHRAQPAFAGTTPQHVTLRLAAGVPSIRRDRTVAVVRGAIAAAHRDDFRVVHFNVLANHLHLIVEAADERALARGMHALTIRLSKRLGASLGRRGPCFDQRYHARSLRTPRETRAAIRYVLLNGRHHAAQRGQRLARSWLDPWSSAIWFDGWRDAIRTDAPWLRALARMPCPTATPRTWLLREGWRRGGGPIAIDDVPGP
jgi:putative transposase